MPLRDSLAVFLTSILQLFPEAEQKEAILRLKEAFAAIGEVILGLNKKQVALEERSGQIKGELRDKDQKLRETQALFHQEKSKLEALSNLTERYVQICWED